jgi:IS5 family transposase
MRKIREEQSTIFDIQSTHPTGALLEMISSVLDRCPAISRAVALDLGILDAKATGRKGLSAESILRAAIVKHTQRFSYEALAFHIMDSVSLRAFCRTGGRQVSKSTLQAEISKIKANTWETINREILGVAKAERIENGRVVRTDATPVETDIHKPYESDLLGDAVRVMTRMLRYAAKQNPRICFHDRTRAVKKRVRELWYGGKKVDKKANYRQLLKHTRETLVALEDALARPPADAGLAWAALAASTDHFTPLVRQLMDQTERRVFKGEKVPEDEKIFSLFEVHTDIIVKGKRDIVFGHKVNLGAGKSGMILDLVVEEGNPADSEKAVEMIERQTEIWGRPPRQCVFDGAYASKANLQELKDAGVKDVVFTKKRGIKVEKMAGSKWIYRKLRNFRAGVEAIISCMKRAYGWTRCNWKGLPHFKAYIWSSAVAYNLLTLARGMTP